MSTTCWLYLFSSNSSPQYEQDVLSLLALPPGSRYRFRYDERHVDTGARERWDVLPGRKTLVCFALQQEAEYQDAAFIPVRLGTVVSTRAVGTHRFVEFALEEFAALPAAGKDEKPAARVRSFTKYLGERCSTPYEAWASLGKPMPTKVADAAPWNAAATPDERFEQTVLYLAKTESFSNARFFRHLCLTERGSDEPIGLTGNPASFDLVAGRNYELRLLHFQGDRRITDRRAFSVAADGSVVEVVGLAEFEIGSRYDEIAIPIHARPQSAYGIVESVLRIEPKQACEQGPRIELRLRVESSVKEAATRAGLSTAGLAAIAMPALIKQGNVNLWLVGFILLAAVFVSWLQVFGLAVPAPLNLGQPSGSDADPDKDRREVRDADAMRP